MSIFSLPAMGKARNGPLLLVLLALTAQSANADTLLNTASPTVPTGTTTSGYTLNQSILYGAVFSTAQTYTVTTIGFNGGLLPGRGNNELFLAVVPVDPITHFPLAQDLSNAVFNAVFTAPTANSDISFSTNFFLTPGQYALIAGSGLFGATGTGFLTQGETPVGSPTYIQGLLNGNGTRQYFSQNISGTRFFVNGTPVNPVPEAPSVVSFGLLLALGLGGVAIAKRRKPSASAE